MILQMACLPRGMPVGKLFTIADLLCVMQFLYPEVEDERDDDENYEHPMTGVGLVLLSAALLETIEPGQLILFTGYSREFVSSIGLNMQNNKLWIDGRYDVSSWLFADGTIDERRFWDHIDIACGLLWLPNRASKFSADPCKVYWDERSC
jgi:hypothetical protein